MTFWVYFFSRIAMNKAFFPCKPLRLSAVNLPIKARESKKQPSGNCLRQEVRPLDLSKLAGNASVLTAQGRKNLFNGNSNSCRPIRSVIIRGITTSNFRSIGNCNDLAPKQEPSAHAHSVTNLRWRNFWADQDSTVFSYLFTSFQLWMCLEINTIGLFNVEEVHWIF